MAANFIVEDGSGRTNANSYVTEAEFIQYWLDRGNVTVAAWVTSRIESNLVKATDYIDYRYREMWLGRRKTLEQALTWPRYGVVIDGDGSDDFIEGFGPLTNGFILDSNVIPVELRQAVIEMAYRVDTQEAAPDIQPGAGMVTRKKVGPIEIEYKGQFLPYKLWRFVDLKLQCLLSNRGLTMQIVRS